MVWNWQRPDWPHFTWDAARIEPAERRFLLNAGSISGAIRHVGAAERDEIRIELIGEEALKTSEIEGEYLDRASVQSSLRAQFGLAGGNGKAGPAERGIAELMADLYTNFAAPLSRETLFSWHEMVMSGTRGVNPIGAWRSDPGPMQVVSGPLHDPRVHFEAPPTARVGAEMQAFVEWFNGSGPGARKPLPALTRAAIAHLYFVCIHPFEDGNGRIARALAEKALAQSLGQPSLTALAFAIERGRKAYYGALEAANHSNAIAGWLDYFAAVVIEAQQVTVARIEFSIAKTKFLARHAGRFNERQDKAILRLFREGPEGFAGGLSAGNYASITKTSRATATRDLSELVDLGALRRTGELRQTRYWLRLGEAGD